jgi:class 3 adenylate cyclase
MSCSACGAAIPVDARFCSSCGAPVAGPPADRRLVTALFCDVVGSTDLAERLDAEVLGAVMNEYAALARRAIESNGGTVASFAGDGALGLFGVPAAGEDDAVHAARAGLDLLASLAHASEATMRGITLQARVGIETGELFGDLSKVAAGTLTADVLNTAARLQAAAEPGTVVVGEAAMRFLQGRAELQPLPPLILKGKSNPVNAAAVVSIELGHRRPSDTPFVGRDRHLASLRRALDEVVADGAPLLATVLGDPGIGKSRLLVTFLQGLEGITVLRSSVPATGEGGSLAPVADLVHAAATGADPVEASKRLASLLAGRPDAAALETALRSLLGLGDASAADHAWALRRLLETIGARGPVVVALDDLHWANAALMDLVEDAARWTRGPVLILCAARLDLLDVRRSWGGGMQRALTITVGPLDPTESRTLATALLGTDVEAAARLVSTAEGNPLFLEQLVAEARELGDTWDSSATPTTIRALLESRLDRCSREVAQMLGVASVQGSRFRLDVLRGLAPEGADVDVALREAQRAHLASEVGPNMGAFAHALVRETAYQRLPKATRAHHHAAIADLLFNDDELAGIHLEQAATLRAELGRADPDLERRAGERLARTGARAFARLDLVTSSDLLRRAGRLLPHGSSARLEMLPDLAVALMESGHQEDARPLLMGAVEEAEQAGSRRDAIRIRLQQLALNVYADVSEDEIRHGISEGRALLEELSHFGDDVGLAQGWVVMEYLHWLVGEMANVEEAAGRSLAHAERAGRLREQVQAGGDQATCLILGPLPVSDMRERAEQRRGSANVIVAAGGAAGVAAAAALGDDPDRYLEAETAWRNAIEAGGLEWPGAYHAIIGLAMVLLEAGDPDRALTLARAGVETMQRLGDVWVLNGGAFIVPIALSRLGATNEAAILAETLDERYVWMGAPDAVLRGVAVSVARTARGRREEALGLAFEAGDEARSTDSNLHRSLALEHLAHQLHGTDPPAAVVTLEEVAAIDAASGNVVGAARVSRTLETWRRTDTGERSGPAGAPLLENRPRSCGDHRRGR